MTQKGPKLQKGPNGFFRNRIHEKTKKRALLNWIVTSGSSESARHISTLTHTHTYIHSSTKIFFCHSITDYFNENCFRDLLTKLIFLQGFLWRGNKKLDSFINISLKSSLNLRIAYSSQWITITPMLWHSYWLYYHPLLRQLR